MVRESQYDNVNNPEHYALGKVECIDAIESALTPEEFRGFLKGNIMKYVWRERKKSGVDSLRKAEWYQKRLIKFTTENNIAQAVKKYQFVPQSQPEIFRPQDRNPSGECSRRPEVNIPRSLMRDDPFDAYERTDGMYHHLKIQEIDK
jgi:hypothetical protein